jgi:hypothetical protein
MSEQQRSSRAAPYSEAAVALWDAGWHGVLPLPERSKSPPPHGLTGAGGAWPSRADVQTWVDDDRDGGGAHNVALRLPPDVLGIDVDDYAGKIGKTTLRLAVERYGPLPSTWRSTSREGATSGIYLYRVPDGLVWPGELGTDVELIQTKHRYMVAPPSVHPNGGRYRWVRDDDTTSLAPPTLDELPALPSRWVEALGMAGHGESAPRAGLDMSAAAGWLAQRAGAGAPMCEATTKALATSLAELSSGARHVAALRASLRLVHLAGEGHHGVSEALSQVAHAFIAATVDPARGNVRPPGHAEREWAQMLHGAVDVVAAGPTFDVDRCAYPLAGLLDPGPSRDELAALGTAALLSERLRAQQSSAAASQQPSGAQGDAQRSQLDALGIDQGTYDRWRASEVARAVERLGITEDARDVVRAERAAAAWTPPAERSTVTDLRARPIEPVLYTVEQVMPRDSNVLLTAAFKAGKTTLVNHLAACLADGVPFLGRFDVPREHRVGVWNYEVGSAMYARWWQALDITNGDAVNVVSMRGERVPLDSPIGRQWAIDWLRAERIDVWIVDPFARAFTGDSENDNTAVGRFLEMLDDIKLAAGVTDLVLVTHTGRGDGVQERARGASRLDDWPDARWLLVRDDQDVRYFRAIGRDVDVAEGVLDYNAATRSLHYRDGSRKASSEQDLQAKVLAIVRADTGINLSALRAAVRRQMGTASNSRVDRAVSALASQQLLFVTESERGGPTQHWAHDPSTD